MLRAKWARTLRKRWLSLAAPVIRTAAGSRGAGWKWSGLDRPWHEPLHLFLSHDDTIRRGLTGGTAGLAGAGQPPASLGGHRSRPAGHGSIPETRTHARPRSER